MGITVTEVIDAVLKLRKAGDEMKERHKTEMAPINDRRLKLEAWLQNHILSTGTTSVSAKGVGTAFLQTNVSITVEDWAAQLGFIKENEAWELLEHRVSKSAVQDYIDAHGDVPPGLSVKTEVEVRIRKG